jgi:hypothetical protein
MQGPANALGEGRVGKNSFPHLAKFESSGYGQGYDGNELSGARSDDVASRNPASLTVGDNFDKAFSLI